MLDSMLQRYAPKTPEETHQAYREILQEIVLAGLWKGNFFDQAAFYGGTALRILYGLDRFSEDLDFSLLKPNPSFTIQDFFSSVQREFDALSIPIELTQKQKRRSSNIQSAFLNTDSHIHALEIQLPSQRTIKIKIEVDINPPLGFQTEEKLLLLPFSFYVKTYAEPDLFAGKMHALLFRKWRDRVKGRDFYDFEWYVRRGTRINLAHFLERAHQSGDLLDRSTLSFDDLKGLLHQKMAVVDFGLARRDVEPFLKDTHCLDVWSNQYFSDLVNRMAS